MRISSRRWEADGVVGEWSCRRGRAWRFLEAIIGDPAGFYKRRTWAASDMTAAIVRGDAAERRVATVGRAAALLRP
jgi:hypothetical protein